MNETSLNAKCRIEDLSSFQSVLAHGLAYWDSISLYISLIKQFFKLGFTPCRVEQPLQSMELQEKKHKKIKA